MNFLSLIMFQLKKTKKGKGAYCKKNFILKQKANTSNLVICLERFIVLTFWNSVQKFKKKEMFLPKILAPSTIAQTGEKLKPVPVRYWIPPLLLKNAVEFKINSYFLQFKIRH